jgi:hypothetical protein
MLASLNGYTPQQSTCPRCGIQRTVRLGFSGISLCMNCRTRWGSSSAATDFHEPRETYPFTPTELARLEIYRRAIAAGYYTD